MQFGQTPFKTARATRTDPFKTCYATRSFFIFRAQFGCSRLFGIFVDNNSKLDVFSKPFHTGPITDPVITKNNELKIKEIK